LLLQAWSIAANTARGGKGSVYLLAAGNGGANNDNCNYDGYANSRFTIGETSLPPSFLPSFSDWLHAAVGAIDNDGVQSYYSERCASIVVSAPSSS